jgi:hypothetical protein
MDAQTVTAIASAGVAAISAVVSVYYSHRSTQYALRSAQYQYEDHMRVWAERTVDVTAQLVELLSNEDGEQEFNARRGQLVASLRCQIDKGRWFFPNILEDQKGAWKPPASAVSGSRYSTSWWISLTRRRRWTGRNESQRSRKSKGCNREFVSEIQQRLNPSERDANYRQYVSRYEDLSSQFVQESLNRPDHLRTAVGDDRSNPLSG